jgi:hypothetical protein
MALVTVASASFKPVRFSHCVGAAAALRASKAIPAIIANDLQGRIAAETITQRKRKERFKAENARNFIAIPTCPAKTGTSYATEKSV